MAGTICDGAQDLRSRWSEDDLKGSKAPVVPFYKIFRLHGIDISWATIRKFMGAYKPDHLRMLLAESSVQQQWVEKYGNPPDEAVFQRMLSEFQSLMTEYILDKDLARPVDGAVSCFERLRRGGCVIGMDTGYFADDAQRLRSILLETHGLQSDVFSNAEETPGRPSPFMIYDCMRQAYDLTGKTLSSRQVVKVDDTGAGIASGRNAGAWTIGVYASGSSDYDTLAKAEPDFLVPDVSYVPEIVFGQIASGCPACPPAAY